MDNEFVLLMRCADQPGILARVTGFLYDREGDVRDAAQFGDPSTGLFFVRIHFRLPDGAESSAVRRDFEAFAKPLGIQWVIRRWERRLPVMIAVSKAGHCLNDLLHRWRIGALPIKVMGVISNHETMRPLVEWHDVPFHYVPVQADTKREQEAAMLDLFESSGAELMVLARYMQILSPEMCTALSGRCINIHHSFLPSFKGAHPYHRAHELGVKLIGATAHYVTPDLDEGPIIEQDVRRVSHAHSPQDLVAIGRDTEASVLARAVKWHAERRIMLNGRKTVVFT
ncbi:formyltetrahydrofolate deformylase [Iodidimonas muriae]|uniref:Formyltetrahydrofolate deformylase n=1 Tax=Iodidimonas muriae TaxID=261467 RepID=A0ABQ2LF84_9PROT|nr:formyltetrahydrofolate deformylase [Iodidimonas muriae]GER07731.1 formyltetrahydrofolate deformylase [Kordiimonadales bacterium JCM 17843]GGO14902.1 formyltetrahydrofolate deformylase [Iodidimonas muriae]